MAITQDILDRLELALAKGEKKVVYDDKSVEFFECDDLVKRINYLKRQLRKKRNPLENQVRTYHDKGL